MFTARADFTIDGPGISLHVHGDAPVFIADVRGGPGATVRALSHLPGLIHFARTASRLFRTTGMRVEVRFANRTIARLG